MYILLFSVIFWAREKDQLKVITDMPLFLYTF